MVLSVKIVNGFQPLTILVKSSILNIWEDDANAAKNCYPTTDRAVFHILEIICDGDFLEKYFTAFTGQLFPQKSSIIYV